jgi:hypothetical protein
MRTPKSRWNREDNERVKIETPVINDQEPETVPLDQPAVSSTELEPPPRAGRKTGSVAKLKAEKAVPMSTTLPADLMRRLRKFRTSRRINVSGYVAMLIDADLKGRGY